MESKMKDKLAVVGAIVLFIGLALQFVKLAWAPYVYLVGACLFAYVQLVSDYKGKNIIIRRFAPSAAFRSHVAGVDRSNHVAVETERMDCLPDGSGSTGTLHGFPYSAGRSKGELV